MKKVKLSEGLSLSAVVQGFWRLDGWNWSAEELARFMNECIERGVTTFDTAEIYGDALCETLMGQAFEQDRSIRNKIQLVSKTGIFKEGGFGYYDTRYDRVKQSCEESLKRLHTDHLDLYLIHREDPCIDFESTAKALTELKQEGKIGEMGVSNFDPHKFNGLNKAVNGQLVTNQIEWNPVCFEHFNSGMMDDLTASGIHPMIWSPLAGGRMFDTNDSLCAAAMKTIKRIAEKHDADPSAIIYAWIMYHPAGAVPISGSNRLDRLDTAIKALDIRLEHYEWYEIYKASGQQAIR